METKTANNQSIWHWRIDDNSEARKLTGLCFHHEKRVVVCSHRRNTCKQEYNKTTKKRVNCTVLNAPCCNCESHTWWMTREWGCRTSLVTDSILFSLAAWIWSASEISLCIFSFFTRSMSSFSQARICKSPVFSGMTGPATDFFLWI